MANKHLIECYFAKSILMLEIYACFIFIYTDFMSIGFNNFFLNAFQANKEPSIYMEEIFVIGSVIFCI